ncbi:YraN family protein [bacterium 1xD8-48]|nr:YraN family protein [Lachnospiraceae bacterium]NBJ97392.1 YraN family protein [bacterium 1xD8-48]
MNKRTTGKLYEEKAAAFLEEQGFFLLDTNYRCRQGEVDLIGIHDGCLVFVEVKYRKDLGSGAPEEAVGPAKQMKICRVSDYYRLAKPAEAERQIRYDVVAICGEEIRWYRDAFPYVRKGRGYSW